MNACPWTVPPAPDQLPGPSTRLEALEELRRLAAGLPRGPEGEARLVERVAASDHADELRAALCLLGAAGLLLESACRGRA